MPANAEKALSRANRDVNEDAFEHQTPKEIAGAPELTKQVPKIEKENAVPTEGDSANSGDAAPKDSASTTVQEMIVAITSLRFIVAGARVVNTSIQEEFSKLFGNSFQYELTIVDKVQCEYEVWKDKANQQFYVIRINQGEMKWSSLSELFEVMLGVLGSRMKRSLVVMREPQSDFLSTRRVMDPASLGFPLDGVLSSSASDGMIRNHIEGYCIPEIVSDAIVRGNVLGDRGELSTSSNLTRFSREEMPRIKSMLERYFNDVLNLTLHGNVKLRKNSVYEMNHPMFTIFGYQGVFDNLSKECFLRLRSAEALLMPILRYDPISAASLTKSANINVTRAGFASDIINRTWKAEYAEAYNAFLLSYLQPGEILFDVFLDSNLEIDVRGFAALMMRLTLMYSENSNMTNSTAATQESIDRALVAWGELRHLIEEIPGAPPSRFKLNMYRLRSGNAAAQTQFDFLKIVNGEGGVCVGGRCFAKRNDLLAVYFPNICVRRNYAIDIDEGLAIRDSLVSLAGWRVYEGARAFLGNSGGMSSFSVILTIFAQRALESFVRINEYNRIAWYNIFRMSASSCSRFRGEHLISRAITIESVPEFFLVAPKGFNTNELVPNRDILQRVKMQASFIKEAFEVDIRLREIDRIHGMNGNLTSFPTRRRIDIACASSPLFKAIRLELYNSNEDKKLRTLLRRMNFSNHPLARCFEPLEVHDSDFLHRYGIMRASVVNNRLNFITPNRIKRCIDTSSVLSNTYEGDSSLLPCIGYYDIERMVREKSIVSRLYTSDAIPFLMRVWRPYRVVRSLSSANNSKCLDIVRNISTDVSFEHHVRVHELNVLFMEVDRRNFAFEDDYVVDTHRVDESFPLSEEVNDIIYLASEFYGSIGPRLTRVDMVTKPDYTFVSIFEN